MCNEQRLEHVFRGQKATWRHAFKFIRNKFRISKARKLLPAFSILNISIFRSISSRKVSEKKSRGSTGDDYTEPCSICRKNPAAANSRDSQGAAKDPLLLTSCGNCSATICTSAACAIRSANRDCWECNDCHQQRLDTTTGYLQAYDWIFERLNQKFSERASSAISTDKSEAEQRRCCSDVMWNSNGKSTCLVCFVAAGRLIVLMALMAHFDTIDLFGFSFQARQ